MGRSIYDSFKIRLRLGALEREINLAYWRLAYLYHPDKWDQAQATTGMTVVKLKRIVLHTIVKFSEKLVPRTFAQMPVIIGNGYCLCLMTLIS